MRDKEFEQRMNGMKYALEIAKDKGIEGLEHEVKRRGITRLPLHVTKSECDSVWNELCNNMYNNITVTFVYAMAEALGMKKEEIEKVLEAYRDCIQDVLDLDYMGEHYVNMVDYAIEVKEKYNLDIDVNRIAACQDHYDVNNKDSHYHMARLDRIIQVLEDNQYLAAAGFLKKRMETI